MCQEKNTKLWVSRILPGSAMIGARIGGLASKFRIVPGKNECLGIPVPGIIIMTAAKNGG
jgi:hypothetical protein